MRKIILFIVIFATIAGSCTISKKQATRKVSRLLEMYPDIIKVDKKTDTIYIVDTVKVLIPAQIHPDTLKSLLDEYCQALRDSSAAGDTVRIHESRYIPPSEVRKKIIKNCSLEEILGNSTMDLISGGDSLVIGYKGTSKGLELTIVDHKKEIHSTDTKVIPPVSPTQWQLFKENWLILLIVFFSGAMTIIIIRPRPLS